MSESTAQEFTVAQKYKTHFWNPSLTFCLIQRSQKWRLRYYLRLSSVFTDHSVHSPICSVRSANTYAWSANTEFGLQTPTFGLRIHMIGLQTLLFGVQMPGLVCKHPRSVCEHSHSVWEHCVRYVNIYVWSANSKFSQQTVMFGLWLTLGVQTPGLVCKMLCLVCTFRVQALSSQTEHIQGLHSKRKCSETEHERSLTVCTPNVFTDRIQHLLTKHECSHTEYNICRPNMSVHTPNTAFADQTWVLHTPNTTFTDQTWVFVDRT